MAENPTESFLRQAIQSYGLTELWEGVLGYLKQGYTNPEVILMMVSEDPKYQQAYYKRFPGVEMIRNENKQRLARGLPPIAEPTAATYVALEEAYRTALKDMPGTWDTPANVAKWIAGDVSPAEITERITVAKNYINYDVNPEVRRELREIYGVTDAEMLNYVLSDDTDKDKLALEWDQRLKQANVGGAARAQGVRISASLRDQIAGSSDSAYTFGQAAGVFANVAEQADDYMRLGDMAGLRLSADDLVVEGFNLSGSANVTNIKKKLASQERARFSGTSGLSARSLTAGGLGSQ